MSLADVPIATACVVHTSGPNPAHAKYRAAGVTRGSVARVLARYPSSRPAFAEVEIEGGHLVTVPLCLASSVGVRLLELPPSEGTCGCETPCPGCSGACGCGGSGSG
jgi:hypothetical protein